MLNGESMYKFETPKDIKKLIRSILELAVLVWVLFIIVKALFTFVEYVPYESSDKKVVSGEDHGFIALSYFGIDREGTPTRISEEKLKSQLGALNDNGYVTITQKDIEDYYKSGTPLPDKSLFLMFEDGRQDTSIYAQKIMEEYNYKATMFTYAEKFDSKDSFFLMPKDLKKLEETGFWEMGSSGYRLSYINVFDRYGRFIGELSSVEYSAMSQYLGRNYNHYLMDFLRDVNGLPMETGSQMKERIYGDYVLLRDAYTEGFGKVPGAYILLHSNTGRFGENDRVSKANEDAISTIFTMNFNREGYSRNDKSSSIYDLTRLEPQANWFTNHLLMRIWDDLPNEEKGNLRFVVGDSTQKERWLLKKGAVEYQKDRERIALTSLPEDTGCLKLIGDGSSNVQLSTVLTGNKLGCQSVILRANDDLTKGVEIMLRNNILYLMQDGEVLEEVDLYDFDGTRKISVEEDKRNSLAGEYAALAKYAVSARQSADYVKMSQKVSALSVSSVEDGAEEYRPQIKLNEMGNRKLDVDLRNDYITVKIDGKPVWEQHSVETSGDNGIYLQSGWTEYGYSQRNIADDVYDGVFEKLEIKDADTGSMLYTYRLTGVEKARQSVKDAFDAVVNWFITNI